MSTLSIDQQLVDTTAHLLANTEPADIADTLRDSGWYELWDEDPSLAAQALFGQQGRLAKASSMLTTLIAPVVSGRQDEQSAVLLPRLTHGVDGVTDADAQHPVTFLAHREAVTRANTALAVLRRASEVNIVEVQTAQLASTPISGLDPESRLCSVDVTSALQDAVVLATGTEADAQWSTALALGRRLLAEEMIGVVAAQLDLTLEHARSRTQFGRQIGSFQAVKHKLAETHVALAVARLAADDAWTDTGPIAALMAKLHAGAAVQVANRHCQQLLGGIGFTWEHPFHRYYRRGRILDALLGSSQQLTTAIGRQISERRTLPSTAQL